MQLGRHSVSTLVPEPIHNITFAHDAGFFAVARDKGYEIWRTWPLGLVRRRELPGSLALALILPHAPLLLLQGGGATPLYAPNKVVVYNDKLSQAVAELEFGERVRGVAAQRGLFCVALSRKVVAFRYGLGPDARGKGKARAVDARHAGFWLDKVGEWETAKNERGLMALSTRSTLLALPGRQTGHVQLIRLPPSQASTHPAADPTPQPAFRSPIILAHTHPLSTLATTPTGSHIITTSERGTLLRVWDTARGRLENEFRRGVDPAEMWGVAFHSGRVVGWSDKGTVHVWGGDSKRRADSTKSSAPIPPSLTNLLSRNLPLPKYFSSITSSAQYHLPRKNPHAFSAALAAAGVPSIAMRQAVDDIDRTERFVVAWVQIDADVDGDVDGVQDRVLQGGAGSVAMGSREERVSSGSDGTSRTATPTPTPASGPGPGPGRGRSAPATDPHVRVKSHSSHHRQTLRPPAPARHTTPRTEKQMQLIAITFSGDWYRLKIPEPSLSRSEGREEGREKVGKCELVEYRRLGAGSGGW